MREHVVREKLSDKNMENADEMILPQKLIDVLERDATELEESDDGTGEQEYAADSDTDRSSDGN